jgi:hypothetical protein
MKVIYLAVIIPILFSCKSKNEVSTDEGKDTTTFYQVRQFVDSEINTLKLTPYLIYKLTVKGDSKDSVVIDTSQFIKLAYQFTENDINDPKIKKLYKETVFEDQSTKSYVLNYTTTDASIATKNIDVMLDNESQELKRIDMRKSYVRNDTAFDERLAWLPNRKFQIIQIATKGNIELTKQTYVVWNDKN